MKDVNFLLNTQWQRDCAFSKDHIYIDQGIKNRNKN